MNRIDIPDLVSKVLRDGIPRTTQEIINAEYKLRDQSTRIVGQVALRTPGVKIKERKNVEGFLMKNKEVVVWEWKL